MVQPSQNGLNFGSVEELHLGIWGEIKTAKTSIALSFPKPLIEFDLDLSFVRAAHRFKSLRITQLPLYMPLNVWLQQFQDSQPPYDIISIPYQVPFRWPGQKVHGMKAMWEAFLNDVTTAYLTPWVNSVAIDTGTMVWKIATAAHLERVQVKNPDRVSLIQIEYAWPNTELRGLYSGATTYHKNLCITHHVGGVYEDKLTPKGIEQMRVADTWDGFSGMGSLVDMVGRTYITRDAQGVPTPMLQVHTCGLTLAMEGRDVAQPSYESIMAMINDLREQGL